MLIDELKLKYPVGTIAKATWKNWEGKEVVGPVLGYLQEEGYPALVLIDIGCKDGPYHVQGRDLV